jgi:nucleoside phosphorylase
MLDPQDYTVGWICAIEPEHVAAQEFLDEEHEGPECVSEHDNNVYTLGKIGKHNVVVAVLPNGEYGLAAAGNVANDMLHSFPNVRIGLMVGIGGGAPNTDHDIRLGDVVVSCPHNGQGSVFQYDFGKEMQDQGYKYTRLLNEPPTILNAAVAERKTKYRRRGHQLEEAINSILEKNPRLRKEYKRPDSHTDRLYQASHTHPRNMNKVNCSDACGNDSSTLVQRPDRIEDKDIPKIHYGVIASGNTLMKNAEERDRLVREKDVLCFEMEAAGLRKDFPCLVIRGICDYSDSHKTKEWQGYAAMAAAAYTKDLLCQIAPNRVKAERKISDILSSG